MFVGAFREPVGRTRIRPTTLLSGRTHREALVAFLVARLAQRRQSMSIRLPRTWWVILAVELALIVILIRLLVAVTTAFWGWP